MKKRFIYFICMFIMMSCFSFNVYASDGDASGVYQGLNWEIVNRQLRIWGNGGIDNTLIIDNGQYYDVRDIPWRQYEFEKVIVEEGVTALEGCFKDCKSLKEAVLPSTMEEIVGTFWGCSNLEKASLQEGVTLLYDAFAYCKSLKEIVIPTSVTKMNYSFVGCSSLKTVVIPANITSAKDAFRGCSNLEYVEVEEGVHTIDSAMFKYCKQLHSIHLPSTITNIYTGSFQDADALQFIYYQGSEAKWKTVSKSTLKGKVICLEDCDTNMYFKHDTAYFKDGMITIGFAYVSETSFTENDMDAYVVQEDVAKIEKINIITKNDRYVSGTIILEPLKGGIVTIKMKGESNKEYETSFEIIDTLEIKNFTVTQKDYKSISLKWDKTPYASYYQVYRYNNTKKTWMKLTETTKNTYSDTDYKMGKPYRFCIRAIRTAQDGSKIYGEWSDKLELTLKFTQIPRLSMLDNGDMSITLSWDKVPGATRYIVYRKSINNPWKKILTLKGDVYKYTSKELLPNTYTYQIKAAKYDGKDCIYSSGSKKLSVKIALQTPTIHRITHKEDAIAIRWTTIPGATHYELYCSNQFDGTYKRIKKTIHTICNDTTTQKNQTYYYKVRALKVHNKDTCYSIFSDICQTS